MLSKTQSKYIRSLALLKFRKEHKCFIVEGEKIALEWLNSGKPARMIVGLEEWLKQHEAILAKHPEATIVATDEAELKQVSTLQTPNKILLVVPMPGVPDLAGIQDWCIALDGLRDPGNMGTILRIADWFGIGDVVCSQDCVDAFSPKVIQSAMGAQLRVNIHTATLEDFIQQSKLPAIAATLEGEDIYCFEKPGKGIIIIGNESAGIRQELIALCAHSITIPKMGGAESLNAGVSAGIICALLLKP